VADELRAFGFRWFGLDDSGALGRWLDRADHGLLDDGLLAHNHDVARRYFSTALLPGRLDRLFGDAGWGRGTS
jgi:hypothetical protein